MSQCLDVLPVDGDTHAYALAGCTCMPSMRPHISCMEYCFHTVTLERSKHLL